MYNSIHIRFLLPVLPVLILCAMECAQNVIKKRLVVLALAILVFLTGLKTAVPEHDYIRHRGSAIHTFSQKLAPLVKSGDLLFAPVDFLDASEYEFELKLFLLLYLDYAHAGGGFWKRRNWFREAGATSQLRLPTYHQFARRKMEPTLFNAADAKELNTYWHKVFESAHHTGAKIFLLLSGLNRSALNQIAVFDEKFRFTQGSASGSQRVWSLYEVRVKNLSANALGTSGRF